MGMMWNKNDMAVSQRSVAPAGERPSSQNKSGIGKEIEKYDSFIKKLNSEKPSYEQQYKDGVTKPFEPKEFIKFCKENGMPQIEAKYKELLAKVPADVAQKPHQVAIGRDNNGTGMSVSITFKTQERSAEPEPGRSKPDHFSQDDPDYFENKFFTVYKKYESPLEGNEKPTVTTFTNNYTQNSHRGTIHSEAAGHVYGNFQTMSAERGAFGTYFQIVSREQLNLNPVKNDPIPSRVPPTGDTLFPNPKGGIDVRQHFERGDAHNVSGRNSLTRDLKATALAVELRIDGNSMTIHGKSMPDESTGMAKARQGEGAFALIHTALTNDYGDKVSVKLDGQDVRVEKRGNGDVALFVGNQKVDINYSEKGGTTTYQIGGKDIFSTGSRITIESKTNEKTSVSEAVIAPITTEDTKASSREYFYSCAKNGINMEKAEAFNNQIGTKSHQNVGEARQELEARQAVMSRIQGPAPRLSEQNATLIGANKNLFQELKKS